MKKFTALAALCFLLTVISCADPDLGKHVDYYTPFSSSGMGHKTAYFSKKYKLDYNYTIDEGRSTVTFAGKLSCVPGVPDWNYSEGRLEIRFISDQGMVVAKHSMLEWWDEDLCSEKSFQATYTLLDNYDGITFYLEIQMHE